MRKRHKMGASQSRKNFRRGTGVHRKNMAGPMRGGIRL